MLRLPARWPEANSAGARVASTWAPAARAAGPPASGVARRPGRLEAHVAELEPGAVGERREGVLGPRAGAQVDARAGAVAQLEVAGDEVGVEVREDRVLDAQAQGLGVGEVLIDVALRVHDRG